MIKLPSLSLFSRLYLTIAKAIIISGTISFFIIDKMKTQTAVDEYVFFTDHLYHILLKEKDVVLNTPIEEFDLEVQHFKDFLMSWQIKLTPPPYDDLGFLGETSEVSVYFNNQEQYISVYKLPNIKAWLLITENNLYSFDEAEDFEHEHPLEEGFFSKYSFNEVAEVCLLLIVILSAVAAIYWPIRLIQRQIENLIAIQQKFGTGNLHIRAHEQFSKPINQLADSFNYMASSISDTVNENQIFAQAVPHEVRTPLSRIQLAVGLLKKNNTDLQQIALLNNIDSYIDDMSELTRQVVAFSKLNSVEYQGESVLAQKVALGDFIESRIKVAKCDKQLSIIRQFDASITLTLNPAYLRLLIDNLLKNACTHAKQQLTMSLHIENNSTVLIVEDDGDGIPTEYLDSIFIPFSRIDVSRNRKTGGLGLGLTISKAACKRMNSELSVENSSIGAKFTCRFFGAR